MKKNLCLDVLEKVPKNGFGIIMRHSDFLKIRITLIWGSLNSINCLRVILHTVCLLIFFVTCYSCTEKNEASFSPRPNVLFIAVDDLRPLLSCYGSKQMITPNIDLLAQRALLFENAYCQFPLCGPSRASALTGLRPNTIEVYNNKVHFREKNPSIISLPQHFKNNGYNTVGIGKVFHDTAMDSLSWNESGLVPYTENWWADYVEKDNLKLVKEENRIVPFENSDVEDGAYFDGKVSSAAVEKIKEFGNKRTAFFLGVGFFRPHLPFNSPKKYHDLYASEDIVKYQNTSMPADYPKEVKNYNSDLLRRKYSGIPAAGPFPDSLVQNLNHAYYASVSYVDAQIGRVLEALEQNGLSENTIVVLWGDHGYSLNEHGSYGKNTLFESSLRAPLIVSVPWSDKAMRTGRLTELIDIYPSLCELTGLEIPGDLEGKSFVDIFDGKKANGENYAISQLANNRFSVRSSRYRYTEIWDGKKIVAKELYDYESDSLELKNLANNQKYSTIMDDLGKVLEKKVYLNLSK